MLQKQRNKIDIEIPIVSIKEANNTFFGFKKILGPIRSRLY